MAKIIDFITNKLFKSSWNYRIVKRHIPEFIFHEGEESEVIMPAEDVYYIAEVYYSGKRITSYVGYFDDELSTAERNGKVKLMEPFGTSLEELRGSIDKMLEAFNRPVLEYEELIELDSSEEEEKKT